MKKTKVAILGATGNVGQRFVQLLANHPWFEIAALCASQRSAGKKYKDVVTWKVSDTIPQQFENSIVSPCIPIREIPIAFSGLDSTVAGSIEEDFAKAGCVVISNSKNHRMDDDVPLVIPEVNPDHLSLITLQKKRWKSNGYIVTNPNCTTIGLTMVLKPLHDAFGVKQLIVTSMQALSGAGYPGVPSLDILDNVIPFIGGEEEKVESEPLKSLGTLAKNGITPAKIAISAQCNRVALRDGHVESVTISFHKKPSVAQVIRVLEVYQGLPQKLKLPSAPQQPVVYTPFEDRPQPVLDRNRDNGMSVIVGRIQQSTIFDIKLTLLVHNTIRGAAGTAILNAELLKAKKYIS